MSSVVPGGPVYELPPWYAAWMKSGILPWNWFKPAPPAPAPPPPTTPVVTDEVVAAINVERARLTLRPLVVDHALVGTALYWATDMGRLDLLTHGNFSARIATVHPRSTAGECIADGYQNAAGVVAGWMASPEHRPIVLGDYDLAGSGKSRSKDGTIYWCCDFSKS